MSDLGFYEIVRVLGTANALALGVDGAHGVVVGIAHEPSESMYAVLIESETVMLARTDLVSTGQFVDRHEIYSGEVIRVSPERYPEIDTEGR